MTKQKTSTSGTRAVVAARLDAATVRLLDELRGDSNRSLYLSDLLARVLPQEAILKHLLGK
jgi:hypothetical protein